MPITERYTLRIRQLSQIDRSLLREKGIRGIILDLDNTIVSEDDVYLSPDSENWIREAQHEGLKLFLLSNGKRKYRVNYWSARLNISAISPARKPFPKSFRRAIQIMQLKPRQVVVIGDSFHTDVLGSILVGCSCVQVASLPHPPRWWEKILGKWVQVPYLNTEELWLADCEYLYP
ncbi:YqeG family HAD IIIA-type phosphatase [Leptolyngbya sp. KIOST-1]|uniref:YqeG family HAD IIIA-type phosphatase n=1 Tax=Leptolyngbya sp. KIOST-1 TaxID=1229172 RepID=UPI0009077757|nr:YqeG family HAD IIIA-type phosphatase [Leptolyngbya sp. KIOST-1]